MFKAASLSRCLLLAPSLVLDLPDQLVTILDEDGLLPPDVYYSSLVEDCKRVLRPWRTSGVAVFSQDWEWVSW